MKKSSLTAAIFLAALAITTHTAHAATATQLRSTINSYGLTAGGSGNTVTVTGTKTGATTKLTLDIDAGVTVNWTTAELTGRIDEFALVSKSGTGSFNISGGKISATGSSYAVGIDAGTANISGGTFSATTASAFLNNSTGAVTISDGTFSATTGYAVYNNSSAGALTISGGTFSATTSMAIYNSSTGKITVSGTAKVTSANVTATQGTIWIANSGTATDTRLEITGGTVENTASDANARAVYNASTGAANISGGTVSATTGVAVYNASTGKIVLNGEAIVTSANVTATEGTIVIASSGTVTEERLAILSGSVVENTANNANARAVYNNSTGTVRITGDVSATKAGGYGVYNNSSGAVNITSAAYITATTGRAVHNNGTGTVNISGGGYIAATTGVAVYNASTGKIAVSGEAIVTSANVTATEGTIVIASSGTATAARLEITGGTVRNTASNANARAVQNASTGAVSIGGGVVAAATGYAVYKSGTGATALTGGFAFAYGTAATDVIYGGYTTPSGNAVIAAWNKPASGTPAYTALSSTDIVKSPEGATAVWDTRRGIAYANGTNTGFYSLYGLATVNKINSSAPAGLAATYGQTLANVSLPSGWAWVTSANSVGNAGTQTHKANYTPTDATNYNALTNVDVSIEVAKAAGTFVSTAAVNATYTPTLKLSDISLPANYAWNTGTTALNAGNSQSFAATYTDPSGNYEAAAGSITVNVAKAKIAKPTATTPSHTYIGTEQSAGIAANDAYTVTGDKQTNAGSHTATVALKDKANYEWTDGTTTDLSLPWAIAKADPDMLGVSFPDQAVTHNGQAHSISISGTLPSGVTVSYTGNGKTDVGTYTVTATFAVANPANYNVPAPMTATLEINNKQTYDMSSITFAGKTVTYSGSPQSLAISGTLPSGVTVSYTGNGQTSAGEYEVTAAFAVANTATHNTPAEMTATLTIEKAQIAKPAVANTSLVYTGAEQSAGIAANAAYTIEGNTTGTNASNYAATVALKDKANYEWADGTTTDLSLPWSIAKADPDMLGVSFPDQAVTHNGQAHSIYISGTLPSGVTVSYTGNGQTDVGTHTVTATFAVADPANWNVPAAMTATLEINNKQTYDMSGIAFAGKTVTYSGSPQSLAITGTLPSGVTVSYEGNGQTDVGTHTVTATFTVADPANYNVPAPMTATLTIETGTPIRFTQIASGNIRVQATANAIVLENLPKNAKVEVYSLQGKRIYSTHSGNSQILRIQVQTKGLYVVKIGSERMHVAVK